VAKNKKQKQPGNSNAYQNEFAAESNMDNNAAVNKTAQRNANHNQSNR